MRPTYPTKRRCREIWIRCPLFLAVIMLCALSSGCFVLRGERRYKPDAPSKMVKVAKNSDDLRYFRQFESPDFDLEIGVKDGPVLWDAPFWFYVLPIPVHYDDPQRPLGVVMHLKPKSQEITFEPSQVFFRGRNQVTASPRSIWQDQRWLGTNTSAAFPVTNGTIFYFEFPPWDRMPFQLSIEGIRASGHAISLPSVTFEPTTIVRSQFRLPY